MSIEIRNFSGGMADSAYSGTAGSFGTGSNGIDVHSEPGILKSEWKLTKNSGATVTDLVKYAFPGSDGSTYFFGDSGKCYKRTSGGTWSSPKNFSEELYGAAEYNNVIYVATNDELYSVAKGGGYDLSNLALAQTWTGTAISTVSHQMLHSPDGSLLIAAGQYVSSVDSAGVWTDQALDLPPGWIIVALAEWNDQILIGAYNTTFDNSAIYVWDGYSDSWLNKIPVPENRVNAILSNGRTVIVSAGGYGNIYQFTGNDAVLIDKLPGDYNGSATMTMYPQAIAFYYGDILMGVSNSSGNPCDELVFRLARHNNNYPMVLDKSYLVSAGNTSGVDIGCIVQDGTNFFISWKDTTGGTTYGVDAIDFTAKVNGVYETTILGSNAMGEQGMNFKSLTINMEALPTSCSVGLKYRKNGATSWSGSETINTTNATRHKFTQGFEINARTIEFQLTLTSSGTSTPKINSILIETDG